MPPSIEAIEWFVMALAAAWHEQSNDAGRWAERAEQSWRNLLLAIDALDPALSEALDPADPGAGRRLATVCQTLAELTAVGGPAADARQVASLLAEIRRALETLSYRQSLRRSLGT